jgi:ketosteroid isomerase-like protein
MWNDTGPDVELLAQTFLHEDIEWSEPPDSPTSGCYRGKRQVLELWRDLTATIGVSRFALEELEVVEDTCLSTGRFEVRGAGSGVDLDVDLFHVARVRRGRFDRVRVFLERSQALKALESKNWRAPTVTDSCRAVKHSARLRRDSSRRSVERPAPGGSGLRVVRSDH